MNASNTLNNAHALAHGVGDNKLSKSIKNLADNLADLADFAGEVNNTKLNRFISKMGLFEPLEKNE